MLNLSSGGDTTLKAGEILGYQDQLQAIRRLSSEGTLAHALLVTGPDGVGKTTFALAVAADLTCLAPEDGMACNECRSCELAQVGSHPDILCVSPLKEETTIGQMRELRYAASLVPSLSPRRVVIIERSETLNDQAANAILKVLEDAPPRLILMLLAPSPETVLSTIRSRSIQIPLRPVPIKELEEFLQSLGVPPDIAVALSVYSGGAPGRAVTLAERPALVQVLVGVQAWLENLASADRGSALKMAEELRSLGDAAKKELGGEDGATDRQGLAWVLDALEAAIQPVLRADAQNPSMITARWNLPRLARMVSQINETRRLILAYAQADLQTDRMVIELLG